MSSDEGVEPYPERFLTPLCLSLTNNFIVNANINNENILVNINIAMPGKRCHNTVFEVNDLWVGNNPSAATLSASTVLDAIFPCHIHARLIIDCQIKKQNLKSDLVNFRQFYTIRIVFKEIHTAFDRKTKQAMFVGHDSLLNALENKKQR